MEAISFAPIEYPSWRPMPCISTSSMVSAIEEYVETFEPQIDANILEDFKKKMQVCFVHSVCAIEGESLSTIEHSLQAIELRRRCSTKIWEEARGAFLVCLQSSKSDRFLTMDFGVTGLNSLVDTEACLWGVTFVDANKMQATLALDEAMNLIQTWETHPYPMLDVFQIKQLHAILFNGTGNWHSAGLYRTTSAWTRQSNGEAHTYMNYRKIPSAINELVKEVNEMIEKIFREKSCKNLVLELINLASHFFLEFQSIHPFHDGNGRVGRLLVAHLLTALLPFGPNVLYLYTNQQEKFEKVVDLHQMENMFVDREIFLEAIQGDQEEGYPMRLSTLFIEGIYVAWKLFRSLL